MRAALIVAMLAACSFHPVSLRPGDARSVDAARGGKHDAPGPGMPDAPRADAASPDAPADASITTPPTCDMTSCMAAGGSCVAGACVIHAGAAVTCPANQPCVIECLAGTDCKQGVSCGNASSCVIYCDSMNACNGATFTCTKGCTVNCDAMNTCMNGHYTCGTDSAHQCDLECCANNACSSSNDHSGTFSQNDPGTCTVAP